MNMSDETIETDAIEIINTLSALADAQGTEEDAGLLSPLTRLEFMKYAVATTELQSVILDLLVGAVAENPSLAPKWTYANELLSIAGRAAASASGIDSLISMARTADGVKADG